jgi:hypothetical protein
MSRKGGVLLCKQGNVLIASSNRSGSTFGIFNIGYGYFGFLVASFLTFSFRPSWGPNQEKILRSLPEKI